MNQIQKQNKASLNNIAGGQLAKKDLYVVPANFTSFKFTDFSFWKIKFECVGFEVNSSHFTVEYL